MIKSLVDIGDAAALERIERDAMLDIWRTVGSDAASSLHIAHAERAGMALTAMRGFDFGLFNRAQGRGCRGPVAAAEVVEAVVWPRDHCAPGWRLQVVPASADEVFDARATSLGLGRKGSGAAKMYRDAPPLPLWVLAADDQQRWTVKPTPLVADPPSVSIIGAHDGRCIIERPLRSRLRNRRYVVLGSRAVTHVPSRRRPLSLSREHASVDQDVRARDVGRRRGG